MLKPQNIGNINQYLKDLICHKQLYSIQSCKYLIYDSWNIMYIGLYDIRFTNDLYKYNKEITSIVFNN